MGRYLFCHQLCHCVHGHPGHHHRLGSATARPESGFETKGLGAIRGTRVVVVILWVFLDFWNGEIVPFPHFTTALRLLWYIDGWIVYLVAILLLARLYRHLG